MGKMNYYVKQLSLDQLRITKTKNLILSGFNHSTSLIVLLI